MTGFLLNGLNDLVMEADLLQQLKQVNDSLRQLRRELGELKALVDPILPKTDKILTFKEAACFLRMSERTVRRMVSEGRVPYAKEGGKLYFSQNSLLRMLNN